jgi:hypothetical protein
MLVVEEAKECTPQAYRYALVRPRDLERAELSQTSLDAGERDSLTRVEARTNDECAARLLEGRPAHGVEWAQLRCTRSWQAAENQEREHA